MADIAITAANVVSGANAVTEQGLAGAAITAGQLVYKEAATGKYKLSDADSATAEVRGVRGVALNNAAAGQPLTVQTKGQITIGGTLTVAAAYFASATAGAIAPVADMTTGKYPTFLGFGITASILDLNIASSGVAVP
ncbi:MAG: hypothetical protein JF588_11460 [Caulobacterales bacterium]|nr:hypothetical protein [Caulobacterales bacterium]